MIDAGARITLGSDFPVEDMNPLSGFYAAVTRLAPDGSSPHGPNGWSILSYMINPLDGVSLTFLQFQVPGAASHAPGGPPR